MKTVPTKNSLVQRWTPVLAQFSYDVVHIEGKSNYWADLLSRLLPREEPVICSLHLHDTSEKFIKRLKFEQTKALKTAEFPFSDARIVNDLFVFNGKYLVPQSLRSEVLLNAHGAPNAGHPGVDTTVKKNIRSWSELASP
ncbi:hypothetical protein RCL1_005320 [Eukaryota sp. TZLM3-RCL]